MSLMRTAILTITAAGLLTAGVFGNSLRNHYTASVEEGYAPEKTTIPAGYEFYLEEGSENSDLLKLGQAAGFTFYQYNADDQVYFFRIKDGESAQDYSEENALYSVEAEAAAANGISFMEEVGDETIFAWFPADYGEGSKGSKPFVVSYATETDEFNAVTNPFYEPDAYSPFHQFRHQVTSSNGTVNDFWLPHTKPIELTL